MTDRYQCICGYPGKDAQDLAEHILASLSDQDPPTGSPDHRED